MGESSDSWIFFAVEDFFGKTRNDLLSLGIFGSDFLNDFLNLRIGNGGYFSNTDVKNIRGEFTYWLVFSLVIRFKFLTNLVQSGSDI